MNEFKLVKFAKTNNLKIANTFFRKEIDEKWTWKLSDGKTRNEIDHTLIDNMKTIKSRGDHRLPFLFRLPPSS